MAYVVELNGSAVPIELGGGNVLQAPGLLGTAIIHAVLTAGTRGPGPEAATPELQEALAVHQMADDLTLELEVSSVDDTPAGRPVRGPRGEEALVLEVPDFGETYGQVVLALDEAGALTWHFPVDEEQQVEPSTVRGSRGTKTFFIRRHIPWTGEGGSRGLAGAVGRKVLRHLVYPVTDTLFGPVGRHFAREWEKKRRPYRVRLFEASTYASPQVQDMSQEEWRRMASGRALLFVHGTFSTTHGAFGALPDHLVQDLNRAYNGRVFAFDHHTLSVDPVHNVRQFLEMASRRAPGARFDLDVVCHSRGGIVARTLAERPAFAELDASSVDVRRILFVGTPNNGTVLANSDYMIAMLDRVTTALNLFPTNFVTEWLEAIITVVKIVGHGVLDGLPGLAAQRPDGDFLKTLNASRDELRREYFAITSEFEPARGGLRDLIFDQTMDWVFRGTANDLVVPTGGVADELECPGFPIAPEQVLRFPTTSAVLHTNYFNQKDAHDRIRRWMEG